MVQNNRSHGRGRSRGPRPRHTSHARTYKVICSGCGKEIVVQVPPPPDKKLLCMECFRK